MVCITYISGWYTPMWYIVVYHLSAELVFVLSWPIFIKFHINNICSRQWYHTQNHCITMKWHYDVTMDPIMISEVIMMSHRYHYSVALMTLLCCSWMYSYIVILKDKYTNKYIFILYTLACNDIKPLNSRI